MKRPKLVDYSDSEGESTDPPRPVVWSSERPRPPEPQDANELAQIVIQLQQHYTKEVSDLEHQQEEMERRLGAWKAQIEDRLQLQVNVMASIIKASSLMGHGHIPPPPPGQIGHPPMLTGGRKSLA
ncbi:hypothetical protein LY78DRAFT_649030 [Colletotrichum sublineola]|nr:hypothetical protein LY78DRAFT_649030 [Colletotrichum sublineola]